MPMNDIDQIAANADNLIEILQGIKQKKLEADMQAAAENGSQDAVPIADTQNFAALNDSLPLQSDQTPVQNTDKAPQRSNDDFWDNHTHSPLQN